MLQSAYGIVQWRVQVSEYIHSLTPGLVFHPATIRRTFPVMVITISQAPDTRHPQAGAAHSRNEAYNCQHRKLTKGLFFLGRSKQIRMQAETVLDLGYV